MYASIPFLFTLMMLASFIRPTIFVLATMLVFLSGWIGISYYIRGEFLREKSKDYVSAAISMGQNKWKVMFKHILPNSLTPIITNVKLTESTTRSTIKIIVPTSTFKYSNYNKYKSAEYKIKCRLFFI